MASRDVHFPLGQMYASLSLQLLNRETFNYRAHSPCSKTQKGRQDNDRRFVAAKLVNNEQSLDKILWGGSISPDGSMATAANSAGEKSCLRKKAKNFLTPDRPSHGRPSHSEWPR